MFKKVAFFKKIFLTYVLITIVFAATLYFSNYFLGLKVNEAEKSTDCNTAMKNFIELFNNIFTEEINVKTSAISNSLESDYEYIYDINTPDQNIVRYDAVKIIEILKETVLYSHFVYSVELYFPQSKLYISSYDAKHLAFWNNNEEEELVPYESLKPQYNGRVFTRSIRTLSNNGEMGKCEAISVIKTLPFGLSGEYVKGYMIINILKNNITNNVYNYIEKGYSFYVVDQYNNIIYSTKTVKDNSDIYVLLKSIREESINSGSLLLKNNSDTFYKLTNDKFSYLLEFNNSGSINTFKYLYKSKTYRIFLALIISLIITIVVFFSYYLSKPIRRINNKIKELSQKGFTGYGKSAENDDINSIENYVFGLEKTLMDSLNTIKSGILGLLIHNSKVSGKVIKAYNIEKDAGNYFMVKIYLQQKESDSDSGDFGDLLSKCINRYFTSTCTYTEEGYLALISIKESDLEYKDKLQKIYEDIKLKTKVRLTLLISRVFTSIDSLPSIYNELFTFGNEVFLRDEGIIYQNEEIKKGTLSDISWVFSSLKKLERTIIMGNTHNIASIIDDIEYHFHVSSYSFQQLQEISSYFIAFMYKYACDHKINLNVKYVFSSFNEFKCHLKDLCYSIIHLVNRSRKDIGEKLFNNIIEYTRQNLDIVSLNMLSYEFKMDISTISKLFLTKLGTNYSEYVKNLKFEKAKSILESENVSIEDLANKLGYSSRDYFTRLFKDKFGVTPTEYKKIVTIEKA